MQAPRSNIEEYRVASTEYRARANPAASLFSLPGIRYSVLVVVLCILLFHAGGSDADLVPVRHIEGEALGFLVLRSLDGTVLADGELKQAVKANDPIVMDDLQFRFKDGSFYREITKFTQGREFRLVSDQVVQKGPSFKQESETWIDAKTGKITVRSREKGKEKLTEKHLDLPPDVSNGLLFILVKNVDPNAPGTTVSFVAASSKPRLAKMNISPATEKTFKVGLITIKAQHYVVKTKIEGVAGVLAPLMGKQPPDIHIWIAKSEAPAFLEFEGPLSEDSPVWRIELAAPEPGAPQAQAK
jgi:hypothetical protein